MDFEGNCRTTAMGIMPHSDVERALDLALSLDIPFWPQLPHVSFFEDMYVQTSEHFPGIAVDVASSRIGFSTTRFEEELDAYFEAMQRPETFTLSPAYSAVFHRFLERPLDGYPAIRGQVAGPVSFGYKVIDEDRKPIIYNETVRGLLFDFIQRKVNAQHAQLKDKNEHAFVWVDEPGLGNVFSGLVGYNDVHAREDLKGFFQGIEGPRGLHLCANVDLPYLLDLGIDVLSFDAFQIEFMPKEHAAAVAGFLAGGGLISWGIVPTGSASLGRSGPEALAARLEGYWRVIQEHAGLELKQIAAQALLAPARCCLVDLEMDDSDQSCAVSPGEEREHGAEEALVERAFEGLKAVSLLLREKFAL